MAFDFPTGFTSVNERRLSVSARRYLSAFRRPRGAVALVIILTLTALAVSAPVLFPAGYDVQSRDSFLTPSLAHPFGTDELGRDIFVRAVFGLRTDLSIVVAAVPLSLIVGTALGLVGALSRIAGTAIQRMLDIIVGFPGLILGICIVLLIGPGWTALVVAIAIAGLPVFGRLSRAALLSQMDREYVVAARTLGVRPGTVLVRHILPNAIDPIIVQGAVFVVGAVFIEAALSIVGLGIQPPEPSLGALLNIGIRYINQAPFYVLGPTIVLILLALGFSLLADAMNESVNKK